MTELGDEVNEKTHLAAEAADESANADGDAVHIDMNDSTVKFLNGGKDVSKDMDKEDGSELSFTGLGKEELMKYADDPFWKKVRLALLITFWIGWVAMLVAAIIIIVLAPRCPYRPDQKWFEKESVYQVYPKSFKDSTPKDESGQGAGVGDLQGLKDKVDYILGLGAKTIYINSFYKSGGVDNGMDIVDFRAIDPVFGTMSDFDALRKYTKSKLAHLILDFIPNHTSRNHTWFVKSQKKDGVFKDYYIWAPCASQNSPPNDWKNAYGQSAWTYDSVRKECYLHQYLEEEPDLNLQNPEVQAELEAVLRFWFGKGVDGFNILGADRLVEVEVNGNSSNSFDATKTVELISNWRAVGDEFATKPGKERVFIVTAAGNINDTMKFFGSSDMDAADFVMLKPVLSNPSGDLATAYKEMIDRYAFEYPSKYYLTLGGPDMQRITSEVGPEKVKAVLAIQTLLQGVAVNYYGTEIGMTDSPVPVPQRQDPTGQGRDQYRTPMQWDGNENAGFSEHQPWLPVNPNYKKVNVKAQNAYFSDQVQDEAVLTAFKQLSELRGNESFQWGNTRVGTKDGILWFTRQAEGFPGFLVLINFSGASQTISLHDATGIPADVEVVFHSHLSVDMKDLNIKERAVAIGENHVIVLKHSA